jgi:hypothetical protein
MYVSGKNYENIPERNVVIIGRLTREKIRASNIGKHTMTEERRKKISDGCRLAWVSRRIKLQEKKDENN